MKRKKKILGILLSTLIIITMSFQISPAAQMKTLQDGTGGNDVAKTEKIKNAKSDVDSSNNVGIPKKSIKKTIHRSPIVKSFTTKDGIMYSKLSGKDAFAVVNYTGDSGDMIIPASIVNPGDGKTYPVTEIKQDISGYKKVVNLVIPDSVTAMDNSAFIECGKLKSVKIGKGIKKLESTFLRCKSLTDVELPSTLEKISGAFVGCTSLKKLILPEGLKELGGLEESGLQEITLPDSLTKLYSYTFRDCKNLERVHLNSRITALGDQVFLGCNKLNTVTGGENITSIGERCFGGYKYNDATSSWDWMSAEELETLGGIDFSKLTSIGEYAFYNMPKLQYKNHTLNLAKVESLGMYAFFNAQGIEKLELGERLEKIPTAAFAYSYNLKTIKIPNSVKKIEESAFISADAETVQIGKDDNSSLQEIGENAFSDESAGSKITINTAKSDVKFKDNSFGARDKVTWTVKSEDETGKIIYLNGVEGNDTKDGTTKGNAVKTFARAKEIAKDNKNIKTIYVTGTVIVAGDVSLEGTNAILKRDENFTKSIIQVEKGKNATLSNITIDGNSRKVDATASIVTVEKATLDIKKGTKLQKNKVKFKNWTIASGGAVHVTEGTVNMTGGVIENNDATWGGGVFVRSAVFNMSGGVIENNRAMHDSRNNNRESGGGICTWSGVGDNVLNISGKAVIRKNKSAERGGGISVGTNSASNGSEFFNMTGGTVTENEAGAAGGGIFIQANYKEHKNIANISGGHITNNKMIGGGSGNQAFGGGGIYVNGVGEAQPKFANGELNLTNALISDNTANLEGGGYASCPVSKTRIYLKNSVAIYKNNGFEGRDIYIKSGQWAGPHSGSPEYTITNTMLGGVPYLWKFENGEEVPLSALEGVLDGKNEDVLKLHTDEVGNDNTKKLAKVFITGNTSVTRGGGIGSNGTVNMGEKELTEVKVTKKWEKDTKDTRPDKVTVKLYRSTKGSQEKAVYMGRDIIYPDKDGNWEITFKNLPKSDDDGNLYIYTVKEVDIPGYSATISGNQNDGYTITNTKKTVKTNIKIKKVWDDNHNKYGKRPSSITVNLIADGVKQYSKKLTASDGWYYEFKDLPKYKDGKKIIYTVSETKTPKYNSKISGNPEEGFTVTNTVKPLKKEPKTGDRANIYPIIAVCIISLAVIIYILYRRKKNS